MFHSNTERVPAPTDTAPPATPDQDTRPQKPRARARQSRLRLWWATRATRATRAARTKRAPGWRYTCRCRWTIQQQPGESVASVQDKAIVHELEHPRVVVRMWARQEMAAAKQRTQGQA